MDTATRERKFQHALSRAREITKNAEREGRSMSNAERDEVEVHLATASGLKADLKTAALQGRSSSGLLAAFKSAGWKAGSGERVTIEDTGTKGASFDGDLDDLSPTRREGAALGADERYLHTAFAVTPVDPTTTSVAVLRQKDRTLADLADTSSTTGVIRDLDSDEPKAEAVSTRELETVSLKMCAAIESTVPNIFIASENFGSMINRDLLLSIRAAYDKLVVDAILAADIETTAPQADLFASVRYAIEDLAELGYTANVLAVSPGDAIDLDLYQSQGPEEIYQAGPGKFAGPVFGLRTVVSPLVTFPLVVDTRSFGQLYLSGLSLAQFEENAGSTNTSTVRLEGTGAFGVERDDACTGIGGS